MHSIEINILDPKAGKLLETLADMHLISIKKAEGGDAFLTIVKKLRAKAKHNPPTLETITKEVEQVRAKRHARKK